MSFVFSGDRYLVLILNFFSANFADKDEDNDSKSKLTPNEEEEVEEAPVEKISLPPSEPMKQLLSALEFNVIDMYRLGKNSIYIIYSCMVINGSLPQG